MNLFGACAALLVSGSAMGESVRIEQKWQEGKTYHNRQNVNMLIDMGAVKTGNVMTMDTIGKSTAHEKGVGVATSVRNLKSTVTVQLAEGGGGEQMTYDSNNRENNNADLAKEMDQVLKMSYTAVYDKTGKFVMVEDIPKGLENVQGMDKKSLESNLRQQSVLLPNKEVKVGDTWVAKVSSPLQGMNKDLIMTFNVKLVKVEEVNGRKIAKLAYTGKSEKTEVVENGQNMTIEATDIIGSMDFDVNMGQVYKSDMGMKVTVKPQAGAAVQMNMRVTTELFKVE